MPGHARFGAVPDITINQIIASPSTKGPLPIVENAASPAGEPTTLKLGEIVGLSE
jgi:hypothetical protein